MRSLQMRLVLVLVLLIVSVMVIVGTFMLNQVSVYYFDDFTEQMNSVFNAEVFAMLKNEAKAENGAERLSHALEAYSASMRISGYRNYYILDGKTGQTLFGSNDYEVVRTPAIIAALGGKIGQEKRISSGYIDRANPIVVDNEVKYIVYIKDTKQDQQRLTASMFMIILRTMVFALLFAVILSFFFAKTITNPIENITKGAKKLSMGELECELAVESNDEIGTLTETFNDMAAALNTTLAKVEDERNKLDTLFLYMTDGVTAFSGDGTLIHHNPAAVEMLSFDVEKDKTYPEIFKDLGVDFSSLSGMEGSFEEYSMETGEKTLKVSFARFGTEAEEAGGVIAIIHDFTTAAKLENSRREFVANVSHELRTPLTNVKSYTETLAESPDAPAEMRERFFDVILNETDRMTRIVKDLLTLSRLDSAKMDWKHETFSMRKSVENAYRAMEMEARRCGHKLTLSVDASLPDFYGDRERIEQVFINLLSNAVKYTGKDGKIDFSAENCDEFIKITVKDNGIGIPEKDIPRLFERFYRVDKARSREMGGTGLGLAIAKEIAEHHGGEIKIESVYGKGTTASVILSKEGTVEEE